MHGVQSHISQMKVGFVADQAWTYKKLGFPVPYLVVGRWGLTPFPSKTPLKFVVGAPISLSDISLDTKVNLQFPCSI